MSEEKKPSDMEVRFRSRRFGLATFFSIVGTVALFQDKMTGNEFYMLVGIIMTAYGVSSYYEKKI